MTQISETTIANLALQKLGAANITSLTDNSVNARAINTCYEMIRDREQRAHPWNFCIQRFQLVASSTTPVFGAVYQLPLPAGCLRVLLPHRFGVDWRIESGNILTNEGNTLLVRCIIRNTNPTQYDALFVEALACKIAWHLCEKLTQSNEKKKDLLNEYKMVMAEARRTNAFETIPTNNFPDTWFVAREIGSVYLSDDGTGSSFGGSDANWQYNVIDSPS